MAAPHEDEDRVTTTTRMLQTLASEATHDQLLAARTAVQQNHRMLLLETGQIQLKVAKGEAVDQERKTLLNQALNLVECYLMSLEAALQKVDFLRQLLNPESNPADVQRGVDYQTVLEELLYVQKLHAEKLLRDEPVLADIVQPSVFRGVLKPFGTVFTHPQTQA